MKPQKLILALALVSTTSAQAVVNVQNLIPTSSFQYMGIENAAPEVPAGVGDRQYQQYFLGLNYTFVNDPLVRTNADRTERIATILDSTQTLDFLGGIEFNGA
jgi:hypothetical protein